MKNYLRCLCRNVGTLCGCILMTGCFLGLYLTKSRPVTEGSPYLLLLYILGFCGCFGFFLVTGTGFGSESYQIYRETLEHFKKHGKIDERFRSKIWSYCGQVGYNLAIKDLGLDQGHLLPEKLFHRGALR